MNMKSSANILCTVLFCVFVSSPLIFFLQFSCKVQQPLLSLLPFSFSSCPSSSSQSDIIWPVNGTLLWLFLGGHRADAVCSHNTGPCTRLVACTHHKAVNYIPQTHKHFALKRFSAVWSLGEGAEHILILFEWRRSSSSRGSVPAARDRGPDERITHGQLGFELLTPAFPGSTAWWSQGSTSSKRPSSSESSGLFWLGPSGSITPRWLEVWLFGETC